MEMQRHQSHTRVKIRALQDSGTITSEQRKVAIDRICSLLKGNDSQRLKSPAIVQDLQKNGQLSKVSFEEKLVLAETLRLFAEQMVNDDEASAKASLLKSLQARKEACSKAVRNGIGQILSRLRPVEEAAHKLRSWKANSKHAAKDALPGNSHTSVMVVNPNLLGSNSLHRLLRKEIGQYNDRMEGIPYKSILMLPFEKLPGQLQSLIDYLKIANDYHFHVFGSLPLENRQDAINEYYDSWRFTEGSLPRGMDKEILSRASVLLNHVKVRNRYEEYFETGPLTIGMEQAFAAANTQYFKRVRPGDYYINFTHPGISEKEIQVTNSIDTNINWTAATKNRLNYLYLVKPSQNPKFPGVRALGATTTFPAQSSIVDDVKNSDVPLYQLHARMLKNRIRYFLDCHFGKERGSTKNPETVKVEIADYLKKLKPKQIEGFEILECERNNSGQFQIKIAIQWIPQASEFIVDLNQPMPAGAKG